MLAAPYAPASAGDIPSYYQQLRFNLTSPTAVTTAAGGFANPAVYAAMPGAELEYYWTLDEPGGFDRRNWGGFLALENLGFGVVHSRVADGGDWLSVTDYRLALSFGDRERALGVGLAWSRGDTDQTRRTTGVQLATVRRLGRYLSVGASGLFSTEVNDQTGVLDVAVRPLGDERLAVFGDVEVRKGLAFDEAPWSVGAALEVPAGLKLVGRYFDDESFAVAVAYSLGGRVSPGSVRLSASPNFDDDNRHRSTNYGVRIGFAEETRIPDLLRRDEYYLEMRLKGTIVHTRYRYFDSGIPLLHVLRTLERARRDPRVAGVTLNVSGLRVSPGNAWEIRQKLLDLREEGKRIVVFIDNGGMTAYHLASVADEVVMDPEGLLILPGYTIGRTYLTNLIDRIGLGVEEWRFTTYKSAMETVVRHEMSDADREQRQALVDQYYATVRNDVCASRSVAPEIFDRWIDDVTLFTPELALEQGLVDRLGRYQEVDTAVSELEGRSMPRLSAADLERNAAPSKRWGEPPRIVVVYATGACEMDSGIHARRLQSLLRSLRGNSAIDAVVVRVNSPGGSPLAADVVAEEIKRCSKVKPVVISQGDVAASGGYWLSIYGAEVYAQPVTITGSIGVIAGWVWDKGISEKVGVEGDFVKAGEHADLFFNIRFPLLPVGVAHRTLTEEERERTLERIRSMYDRFVSKVATARALDHAETERIAQGRVWTGEQARELGLVDRIGGLDAALQAAAELSGVSYDEVEVVEYDLKGWFDPTFLRRLVLPALSPFSGEGAAETAQEFPIVDGPDLLGAYETLYLHEMMRHNGRGVCLIPPDFVPRTAEGGR